ncbi:nucleoside diphosphate kinase 6 isoform X1 [Tachyglossus aculeatus]|uniref:nucleoside diphosphate kinase 6 isoform X1 n=1 Tax=Tachyglossus aculeatus TaxID=9261 RepID=UPI0018F73D0F|nr:nucleoside diphosphate kinase 6 isoform X1 [Tachyglossus aculeatus]XP_038600606.1 nucleoside diphosphate kinase 6 isoform X1 [Tachyglossus aculeatus]
MQGVSSTSGWWSSCPAGRCGPASWPAWMPSGNGERSWAPPRCFEPDTRPRTRSAEATASPTPATPSTAPRDGCLLSGLQPPALVPRGGAAPAPGPHALRRAGGHPPPGSGRARRRASVTQEASARPQPRPSPGGWQEGRGPTRPGEQEGTCCRDPAGLTPARPGRGGLRLTLAPVLVRGAGAPRAVMNRRASSPWTWAGPAPAQPDQGGRAAPTAQLRPR